MKIILPACYAVAALLLALAACLFPSAPAPAAIAPAFFLGQGHAGQRRGQGQGQQRTILEPIPEQRLDGHGRSSIQRRIPGGDHGTSRKPGWLSAG